MGSWLMTSCGGGDAPAADDQSARSYESVENDPMKVRIYTLDNGLKVYLSVNKDEPRVMTQIAVRTGSKQDPADATGLAHYLEHMLFKGSSNFSTTNWEEEKVLLKQISDLYEKNRNTTDEEERKQNYALIDSLSYEAAKIAIPNEYDKMISSLGAQYTNAYTSFEQTVYVNDIPSNEMEKWLKVESERFSELVLRLFHTELETVYEEFNRGQDNDYRKVYQALLKELFKEHPYGTQTTIGTGEHLKTPSMEKIHEYFSTHYVPNNMAICLSGDLDPEKTMALIEQYFGGYAAKDVPEFTYTPEAPITGSKVVEVYGSNAEFMFMGYRAGGVDTDDPYYLELIGSLLSNSQAGLMDLNLVQQQQVLRAGAGAMVNKDYSAFIMNGTPRQGQSLAEVQDLLINELNKVKSGDFDDWLLDAVRKDLKLSQIRTNESNYGRVAQMVDAFIKDQSWEEVTNYHEKLASITKDELVKFANENLQENYIAVHKFTGEDTTLYKVDKPQITQLDIKRDTVSQFYSEWDAMESPRVEPLWVNYEEAISNNTLSNGVPMAYIENQTNETFSLFYILDMGTYHDQKLSMAVKYLQYLGTSELTPAQVQQEFYKLGLSFDVFSSTDKVYIMLNGLEESFEEGVQLFEKFLNDVQPNPAAMGLMIDGIMKERADQKKNKGSILYGAMYNYARYGERNPTTWRMSEEEMRAISPDELVERLRSFSSFKHRIFYYGRLSADEAKGVLDQHHQVPETLQDYPEPVQFAEQPTDQNRVLFVDYDMVQTEIMLMSKAGTYDFNSVAKARMFNAYFGSGLSSIVFQEIRESKALAYSAWASFTTPSKPDESHYVRAYLGVQTDKLGDAVDAMLALMNEMPKAVIQFDGARDAAMKKIETNRTTKSSVFWEYERMKRMGHNHDINEDIYEEIKNMSFEELNAFFNENIKGRNYTYLVIGKKDEVDFEVLNRLGTVEVLTLEQIFGE